MPEVVSAKGVNGQVEFDGTFITINRKGLMARGTVGKGEKRIPLSSVSAVQWKPPSKLIRGFIQFTVPGGNEGRSRFGKQTQDAAKDENAVVVGWTQVTEFEVLRSAIDTAIMARETGGQAPASSSTADEIKKLVDLRDSGALSEDEFAAQKAKLLG